MWESHGADVWCYRVHHAGQSINIARVKPGTDAYGQTEYSFLTWYPRYTPGTSIDAALRAGDWKEEGRSPSLEIAQAVSLALARLGD